MYFSAERFLVSRKLLSNTEPTPRLWGSGLHKPHIELSTYNIYAEHGRKAIATEV